MRHRHRTPPHRRTQVLQLLALTTDGTHEQVSSVSLGGASAGTTVVHVAQDTPREMAMRRGLLHGPNMLRGLLTWLADSAAGEAGAAAAAAAAAAAGLAPGECWWQRQWSRRLAPQLGAAGPSGSSGTTTNNTNTITATGSISTSSSTSSSTATSSTSSASALTCASDWGLPQPALQALAMSSFTLQRWLKSVSRAARHLAAKAHELALVVWDLAPGDPLIKAACGLPSNPDQDHDDDCGHIGTHTRAAAGTARLVFQAAAPLVHAFTLCKEFADAARAREGSNSSSSGTAGGGGGGVDTGEAKAVAAEAEAAAEAWKQLLLECLPPCIASVVQLLCVGAGPQATDADFGWLAHALLQLATVVPEELFGKLGDVIVPPSGPRARMTVSKALGAIMSLRFREVPGKEAELRVVTEALDVAKAVQDRSGRLAPGEREAMLAGCAATAGWRAMDSGAPAQPDWARRVGALLPPPALATELLGLGGCPALEGCSNGACVRMPGASAAAAPALRCGGRCGGAVLYCCGDCQAAHWKAGHKAACGKK